MKRKRKMFSDLRKLGLKFPVIYADPAWTFTTYSRKGAGRSAERHYKTMTLEQIKRMPVAELARDDCVLLLWATIPLLPQALEVITAWGFTYKTVAFMWVKQNKKSAGIFKGLGYWTRANAEPCLLATKGKPKRKSKSVGQVIISPLRAHSEKPEEAIRRIEQLVDGPYLELFARKVGTSSQWRAWGEEARRRDTLWERE